MRSTTTIDMEKLQDAKKKMEDLLRDIKSLDGQGSEEQQRQTMELKNKTVKRIEEIDQVLAMMSLTEKKIDENEIINEMEKARGAAYDQNQLPLVKAYLQVNVSTVESYEEYKQDDLAEHLVSMLLFNLVRDAEKCLLAMQPGYAPPESFFKYQDKMMKQATATVLGKNVHLVTDADEKKAKKDSANVVAFFSNIGKNNNPQSQSQAQPPKKPGNP